MITKPTKLETLIQERNTLQTKISDEIYVATQEVKDKYNPQLKTITGQINKIRNENKGAGIKRTKAVKHSMRSK